MLIRMVQKAIIAYKAMEGRRIGNDYRSSKIAFVVPLEKCTNDLECIKAITELVLEMKDSNDGKLKQIVGLLQVAAKAQSNKPDHSALLADLATLKNHKPSAGLIVGNLPGWLLGTDVQFEEDYLTLCSEVEAAIKDSQIDPLLTVQKGEMIQAQQEFGHAHARHEEVANKQKENLAENERLQILVEELKQKSSFLINQEAELEKLKRDLLNAKASEAVQKDAKLKHEQAFHSLKSEKESIALKLATAQEQQAQVKVSLDAQNSELSLLTEQLNQLYLSKESLQTSYDQLKSHLVQEQQEKIHQQELQQQVLQKIKSEKIQATEKLVHAERESLQKDSHNQALISEVATLKIKLQSAEAREFLNKKDITLLESKFLQEASARKKLEESLLQHQNEFDEARKQSQLKLTSVKQESVGVQQESQQQLSHAMERIKQLEAENLALKADVSLRDKAIQIENERFRYKSSEVELLTRQLEEMRQQVQDASSQNVDLSNQNIDLNGQLDNLAQYLQQLKSQFIYSDEEDKGVIIKPGDIKKLIELAGADAAFLERYEAFTKAIKSKVDSKKSSEHNKPYILELELIRQYYEKYCVAYDAIFSSSKSIVSVSVDEGKKLGKEASNAEAEAKKAASHAEQKIGFHNATERVVQQHLSYENKKADVSAAGKNVIEAKAEGNVIAAEITQAERNFIEEANKSININKCRAAFYEELLKRAENLLPKKGKLSIVADLAERLGAFAEKNRPALKMAVTAVQEKEKKTAAMSKPSVYAGHNTVFSQAATNSTSSSSVQPATHQSSPGLSLQGRC